MPDSFRAEYKSKSTYDAASEARYRIALAISWDSPRRFIKVEFAILDQPSLPFRLSIKGVIVGPGQTLLTRTPKGVNSSAAVSASPRTAHLEAPYADSKGDPE